MSENDRNVPVLSIGVVQELTGLSGRQIRYYEAAGLISPRRTGGRRRLYTRAEVDLLNEIKEYVRQGMTLEAVKELLRAKGKLPAAAVPGPPPGPSVEPPSPTAGVDLPGELAKLPAAERLTSRMRRLTSLYPVNNQAGLLERLRSHEEPGQK
ncbi:MAG TPA: MerR family transcriptional regulator [Firmicutes bacterium]|nr:MerR family transcriptional regulator [Bacillota bacterium]